MNSIERFIYKQKLIAKIFFCLNKENEDVINLNSAMYLGHINTDEMRFYKKINSECLDRNLKNYALEYISEFATEDEKRYFKCLFFDAGLSGYRDKAIQNLDEAINDFLMREKLC